MESIANIHRGTHILLSYACNWKEYDLLVLYAYVEHIEIKTKTVNIIHFLYLDLSQNVKIRDVTYSLKSPRNSECKLEEIYGVNKGKVFMSCVLYTNGYVNVNE